MAEQLSRLFNASLAKGAKFYCRRLANAIAAASMAAASALTLFAIFSL